MANEFSIKNGAVIKFGTLIIGDINNGGFILPTSRGSTGQILKVNQDGIAEFQNISMSDIDDVDIISKNHVVANIQNRDNLSNVLIGDQAFVMDKGDGEWGMFLWDGSNWIRIAAEESARVDSDTFSQLINYDTDSSFVIIGEVNDGARVNPVTVEIITPFNDPLASMEIGDLEINDRLMSEEQIDLTEIGTYVSTPSHQYDTGGEDTDIISFFNFGNSTQGQARVTITFS